MYEQTNKQTAEPRPVSGVEPGTEPGVEPGVKSREQLGAEPGAESEAKPRELQVKLSSNMCSCLPYLMMILVI